jgi:phosphonate transport system substrate-binding protein
MLKRNSLKKPSKKSSLSMKWSNLQSWMQNKNTRNVPMKNIIMALFLLFNSTLSMAEQSLTFGVVPQQSASKLAKLWGPIIEELSQQSGLRIHFATAPDIPTFEKRLADGSYDIAYMNPYHYTTFHQKVGYRALAKARDKHIKGIIVVAKNNHINALADLNDSTLAFPAPAAFAASILTRADLSKNRVNFTPKYVSSHDSVYRAVAKGIYPAGGGIVRTFNNVDPEIRNQLKILWTTKGYTPHAIAVHPRITPADARKIRQVLIEMGEQITGKKLLHNIKIKSFEGAVDSDWNDVRDLKLNQLSDS